MDQIARKFNISYDNCLQYAKDMRNLFVADVADFTAFDAGLDTAFSDDWLDDIEAAEAILSDEALVDVQTGLTQTVETAMRKCRECFQEVKYFALRAFPSKEEATKLNELGFDNYDNVRASQTLMLQFMRDLFITATKYATQLDAVNFDAAKLANINSLANALDSANQIQNNFIKSRPVATSERITAYNKIWDSVTLVARAAKIIYRNNPVKYNQFLLPATHESDAALSLKGKVINTATSEPVENAAISVLGLDITVHTDSNGRYGIGLIEEGSYDLTSYAAGFETVNITNVPVNEGITTVQNFNLTET